MRVSAEDEHGPALTYRVKFGERRVAAAVPFVEAITNEPVLSRRQLACIRCDPAQEFFAVRNRVRT